MTGTDLCVNKPHKSRSYLNHLVPVVIMQATVLPNKGSKQAHTKVKSSKTVGGKKDRTLQRFTHFYAKPISRQSTTSKHVNSHVSYYQ
jgi:hypothetical protein